MYIHNADNVHFQEIGATCSPMLQQITVERNQIRILSAKQESLLRVALH